MIRALHTAATGMEAQQFNIDVISNNLANVNTNGFKTVRADFEDLLYQTLRPAGASVAGGAQVPSGLQVGLGARPAATYGIFSTGAIQVTGNPLDLAIEGDGFFKVLLPDGTVAYTRDGGFKLDSQGRLVTSMGYPLEPEIILPPDVEQVLIGRDGTISVRRGGQDGVEQIGQITLVRFINPAGLNRIGMNLYRMTPAAGEPIEGTPGTNGLGEIAGGSLEASNVQIVDEMVRLIMAQRAYEVNSRAIQTADEMLSVAKDLKR
ncbi:MAG: flagellar basal-body rod protein FlgG [Fimbriimonadales bacterium]|jgi:flagellar basal-body rod protein FlgG|nr:flagellar basal-body rod protein FlgG [Armatimonadota bacterium]MCX7688379.1 flagellar basal-body rod protein FlgG [Fimbriimonadales bacterium]CUU10427.1 flagellar basal-body rod protein FlgG [Armatimonadetes bacterium GBS]CUU34620.1 flagellar basal-body rod protein FlgG [Armatimonadetes bacterium DC]CUU37908.1 flagellar basal-body rod protein FlgG [Armatimonadetes bacterium GXS]GBC91154.1 Flagellar basal-body rod protein FlgG [bacterium HR14]